jgi:hypothetical protein
LAESCDRPPNPTLQLSDTSMDGYFDDEQSKPRLLDWKIEMNPRKEYTDPIRISYTYAGGVEGKTIIQWSREAAPEDPPFIHRTEDGFIPLMVGAFRTPKYPNPSANFRQIVQDALIVTSARAQREHACYNPLHVENTNLKPSLITSHTRASFDCSNPLRLQYS